MLPPEMMGQVPPGSQMPPEMMGGGGMPPGLPPEMMGGPPPPQDAGYGGGEKSPVEHLRDAIKCAEAALTAEPDDADSQQLAKVIQGLYAILANRQKEQEQLMGGSNMRALARASQ